MRSLLAAITAVLLTPFAAALAMLTVLLRLSDRPGSLSTWVPHMWTRALLWAGGVRVRVHGTEHMGDGCHGVVFASNHVSWYDVFVIAATLPRYSFVAKEELLRIPVFGPGARAIGTLPIARDNRKSAFASYDTAATIVRAGRPIIVFPEGTRGRSYVLRPFKKGPFVLAIAAGVPIVPVIVHGTMAVMPKGSWRIRSGVVDLHFLEPVPTAGLTYEDRDELSSRVHRRMEEELARIDDVTANTSGAAPRDAGSSTPAPPIRAAVTDPSL